MAVGVNEQGLVSQYMEHLWLWVMVRVVILIFSLIDVNGWVQFATFAGPVKNVGNFPCSSDTYGLHLVGSSACCENGQYQNAWQLWWDRLSALSRTWSTKAIGLWCRSSSFSSASKWIPGKSTECVPLIWKPKWAWLCSKLSGWRWHL